MRVLSFFILLIILNVSLFSQHENYKWGKENNPYLLDLREEKRDYSINGNFDEIVLKSFVSAYWFLISDVDGDNCPFKPSCSAFFIESIKLTNVFQGTLMFFDRFTRDMNIIDRNSQYTVSSYRLVDPPLKYTLSKAKLDEYYSKAVLAGE